MWTYFFETIHDTHSLISLNNHKQFANHSGVIQTTSLMQLKHNNMKQKKSIHNKVVVIVCLEYTNFAFCMRFSKQNINMKIYYIKG